MYGAIMGDIVGSIYEFHNIKKKEFPLFKESCFFTDDTVLTIAVADALANAVIDGSFDTNTDDDWRRIFRGYFLHYGKKYPYSGYGNRFLNWLMEDGPGPYGSAGNGSAMRVSPVAYFARSLEECERLARLTAEPTHDDPDGVAGAVATAGAIYLALHDASMRDILVYVGKFYGEEMKEYVTKNGLSSFTLNEIRPIYRFDKYASINRGTVPFALQAFLESKDFVDCIRNTVSIGGDTDTLCAISGAIAEAYYGFDHTYTSVVRNYLPTSIKAVLNKLDDIGEIAEHGLVQYPRK
jgi:ADP-ribosylglycohydrolase